jgi:hypothetical protein
LEIFLNDLSVSGQYSDPSAFRNALEPLLELRSRRADLQKMLYCSSTFSNRPATPVNSVREAIVQTHDRLYIGIVLRWIANAGPFWDEDRFPQPDDYFEFEGTDVTDQGLGEASRRILGGLDSAVFSFVDSSGRFKTTPLVVVHGLEEDPYGTVRVVNFWQLEELEKSIDIRPTSWKQMLQKVTGKFDLLRFSPDLLGYLEGQPFHGGVADMVAVLLGVLQTLARETRADQSFTPEGVELWQRHTVGSKAWFTDESESNKIDFKTDMTFTDTETGAKIFCPWHGKVKLNQFRIHFEWPRPRGQRQIRIMYIGPKITRR